MVASFQSIGLIVALLNPPRRGRAARQVVLSRRVLGRLHRRISEPPQARDRGRAGLLAGHAADACAGHGDGFRGFGAGILANAVPEI